MTAGSEMLLPDEMTLRGAGEALAARLEVEDNAVVSVGGIIGRALALATNGNFTVTTGSNRPHVPEVFLVE